MKRVGRWLLSTLLVLALPAVAREYPAIGQHRGTITLYSTLDTEVFAPLVVDFQQLHPGIAVRYENIDATPQYRRFVEEAARGIRKADVLISTSMDLQVKLANDGHAARHDSPAVASLPGWARWRNEAFGFTFEPAVMVFNRKAMKGRKIPTTRAELLDQIRRDPAFWRGRLGTYDVSRSSVGYLLASQDQRLSSEFGALTEAFADIDLQVEEHSATLLERIESGELVAGYNLLGSYARAREGAEENLLLVYPRDHTLVLSRTALIAKNAPNPEMAHVFLEYLLSNRGQLVMASRTGLPPVHKDLLGTYERLGVDETRIGVLRPITLGPGLLVYLDQEKRRKMLEAWRPILGSAN